MFRQFIQINAHHRLTKISRDFCYDPRILEVRSSTYDSPGTFQWISRFENAGSDKDTFGSQTHHQSGISWSRTATSRKVHNRQFAFLSNLAHQFIWSAKIFCLDDIGQAGLVAGVLTAADEQARLATLGQLQAALQASLGAGFRSHDIELTIKGWCADCAH